MNTPTQQTARAEPQKLQKHGNAGKTKYGRIQVYFSLHFPSSKRDGTTLELSRRRKRSEERAKL